jgi:hypothetical protein
MNNYNAACKPSRIVTRIDLATIVDELGYIKAKIADLKQIESALAEGLKATGAGAVEGREFRATVSVSDQTLIDRAEFTKALIEAGVPCDMIIAAEFAASTLSPRTIVRVTARKTSGQEGA